MLCKKLKDKIFIFIIKIRNHFFGEIILEPRSKITHEKFLIKKKEPDASSDFQHLLPISSDAFIKKLDNWSIQYKYFEHVPLRTVNESKSVQDMFLNAKQGGGHIKNLFLRDHKKNNILIVAHQDALIDLKKLQFKIDTGRLSFGSSDRLMEHLGVFPGAVTPFSMINGVHKNVVLFIDLSLKNFKKIYLHPLVNDRTLEITIENLEMFFKKINVIPQWIKL